MLFIPETVFKRILILSACLVLGGCFSVSAQGPATTIGVVNVDYLNFRPEPTLSKPALAYLNKGDRVVVLQARNGWLKAVWQGRVGYIRDMEGFVTRVSAPETKDPSDLDALNEAADAVDEKIEDKTTQITALTKKETTIINGLNEIDMVLAGVRIKMADLKKQIRGLETKIAETSGAIQNARHQINVYKKYAGRRLVALYKLEKLGGMPHVLTSADSMHDMFKRKTIFERILAQDQDVLAGYARDAAKLKELLKQQKKQKNEQRSLDSELDDQLRIMTKEKGKRERLLAHIQSEKRLELAVIESLRQAAISLEERIKKYSALPDAGTGAGNDGAKPFLSLKGLLKMPVRGKVISHFGPYTDPKYHVKNFRNGIDIKTERGEPVMAVYGGKVLYADWFKGYGNLMIIDHGEHYYSVYANMEELFKTAGAVVKAGEVIATVGDSGSLEGPKLYFEIRHHGQSMDPMKWVRKG